MSEERRNEVAALGSEFQRASIGQHGGGWGHPIDRVWRPLLSVCLGRRKDLALTTAARASAGSAPCSWHKGSGSRWLRWSERPSGAACRRCRSDSEQSEPNFALSFQQKFLRPLYVLAWT